MAANYGLESDKTLTIDSARTVTISSISGVSFFAGAAVRTRLVNTASMSVTEMNSITALIYVRA